MSQLSFDMQPKRAFTMFDVPGMSDLESSAVERFTRYHAENPGVYVLFEKFARQLLTAGRNRYGALAIVNRIRWHTAIETTGDAFKISNSHAACYARLLAHLSPEFVGFFEMRTKNDGDDE